MEFNSKYTCMTCLKKTENGTSIFEINSDDEVEIKFSDMLVTCINIDLNIFDLKCYPNKLCPSCVVTLTTAWKFIEMCKASEKVLSDYYSNSENLTETVLTNAIETELPCDIKEEIKEEDFSDGASVKSEVMYGSIKLEPVVKKKKRNRKRISSGSSDEILSTKRSRSKNTSQSKPAKRKVDKAMNSKIKAHCPVCEDIFETELKLRKHMVTFHPDSDAKIVYHCKICRKNFKRKTDLVVHRRIHSGEKPFQCSICFKGFAQSGTLIEHSRIHTGETPFVCQVCKRVFASRSSYWRHRLVHSKEKLCACELCGKTFSHRESLRQHKLVHTEEKPYTCDICNRSLKSKYALQQHLVIHASKEFVCEHCGKKFSVKNSVEKHIKRMHSKDSGECPLCSKVTSNLPEHMLLHSGKKPYKCKICNREFQLKNTFSFHLTMHKNAEKYKCHFEGCKKAFPKENMLTFHINKMHVNETPHVCAKCSKGFYRNSDLSRHMNIAHLENNRLV